MKGVRIRDGGFEGQCNYCLEYLPLIPELWPMSNQGLRRCRACIRVYKAMKQRGYKASKRDVFNAAIRERLRMLPQEERARRNEAARQWKARNRDRVAEYNRRYKERRAA